MNVTKLWPAALVVLFAAMTAWLPLAAYALPIGFDTSNLILHLDAQDASSLNGGGGVSDNDAVTGWNDLSGNSNNAASGGGDDDPHYAAGAINGRSGSGQTTACSPRPILPPWLSTISNHVASTN